MDTQEFLQRYKNKKQEQSDQFKKVPVFYKLAGENIVECNDAILLTGKYKDMRVSDIFIFDLDYLNYLKKNENIKEDLKDIIKEVIKNQSQGMDNISREIALK